MLGQNGSIMVGETTDFWLLSGKIANFAGRHLHDYLQIGCALAMTGVISCGRDHCGKFAQKTVGPSKYLHHTLMVHPLGSHIFWGGFCYLFCYIKEDSQAILRFCLVKFCHFHQSICKARDNWRGVSAKVQGYVFFLRWFWYQRNCWIHQWGNRGDGKFSILACQRS